MMVVQFQIFVLSMKDESLDGMNRQTQLVCTFVFSASDFSDQCNK